MIRTTHSTHRLLYVLAGMLMLALVLAPRAAQAQQYTYGEPRFDPPALDAMLAPVALYPDPLLSQVLMAATYPREVEEAARWLRDQPGLSGDAAVRSADGWDWDPSVRSLLAFPMVLQTLADYPSWTADLGEAFLVQREDVMDAIQELRRRALAAGTLRSTEYTRVVDTGYAITIEPVSPQTVYVPYYDPRVTYGAWWWPARPPMYWSRWPGYYGPSGRDAFVYWGPGIRLSAGFFFGNFAWSRREVRVVDVRPYYYPRTIVIERHGVPGQRRVPAPDVWRHDGQRRHADPAREFNRPRPVQREVRPQEAPRTVPQARSFDGRGLDDRASGRNSDPGEARSQEVPRAVPQARGFDGRGFDDRAPGRNAGPGSEPRDSDRRNFDRRESDRRDFDRRESMAAPPRAPAVAAPAPTITPRAPEESRAGRTFDGRGGDRRPDEGRLRQPSAQQAPVAPPRGAQPSQPPQRFLDANEERPAQRRQREPRD